MSRLPRLAVVAIAGCLATAPGARAAGCPDAGLAPSAETVPWVQAAIVCLLNEERAALGLPVLEQEGRLGRSAHAHSADMVAHRYLAHQRAGGPDLFTRVHGAGYFKGARGGIYGENIGIAAEGRATPNDLVRAWMASPSHRTNIVHAGYRDIGVGIVFAPPDPAFYAEWSSVVFTTDFGRRDVRRRCRPTRRRGTAATPRRWCRARRR